MDIDIHKRVVSSQHFEDFFLQPFYFQVCVIFLRQLAVLIMQITRPTTANELFSHCKLYQVL